MRTIFTLMMLVVVVALVSACAAQQTEPPSTPPPAPSNPYTPTDLSTPIEVAAGNSFQVVVDTNPSTGYHWEMIGPLDERYLTYVSREYVADEPVMPGSGGLEIWTFEAVSTGETVIVLGYYPPDQGEPAFALFTQHLHMRAGEHL
ncbi:MAG: protease inhibitor I42 family protein [Chloroflexota bacterium]